MKSAVLRTRSGTRTIPYDTWSGQRLRSTREVPIGFDTETARIAGELDVPDLALAVASDGRTHVVIHADRVADFLTAHADAHLCGHNVTFDFWVLDRHLRQRNEGAARQALWNLCDAGRLLDTQVLDMLLQLATVRFRSAKGSDAEQKVYPVDLGTLTTEYLGYAVDKENPYRLRFGELIGVSEGDWVGVDLGFFEYAVTDAVVTRQLYPAMTQDAAKLMAASGFSAAADRYDIRPDAVEKFGYLSELIQVRAAVVLAEMYRRGVQVDLEAATDLESRYRGELDAAVRELERDHPEVLVRGRDGAIKLTPRRQTPSLPASKLTAKLVRVAEEIRSAGHEIDVPAAKGKTNGVSRSVKQWAKYADRHPFLRLWARVERTAKLLGFFADLKAERMHCRYGLLTRTGRTSCGRPPEGTVPGINIQQMPKLPEFRALFLPDAAGEVLFTGDYAGAELRTLAAVCRARYGRSRLGDVIAGGADPHAVTAAAIQGLTADEFLALKTTDPGRFKSARQAAKALNFGIPGGLGAATLTAYAEQSYGVTLKHDEAEAFRAKLIGEVYPELNDSDGYLADGGMATLARSLGVPEAEAWEVLSPGKREPWVPRAVAKVVAGRSDASPNYKDAVWDRLFRLARVGKPAPETFADIQQRRAGPQLHDRLFAQTAATLTGRIRAGVKYTEAKNTPFQSLCADGGKLALWRLMYAGFRPYAFIHDEVLVSLPAAGAEEAAKQVKAIMEAAMAEVMGHGIPAECEFGLTGHWAKP